MLNRAIASIPEVFICIDALDESSPKHRLELLRSLQDILRESPRVRVFLTGRSHVQDEVVKSFTEVYLHVGDKLLITALLLSDYYHIIRYRFS